MDWIDIASIVVVCVTANHLGMITAIEDVIKHRLPIVNCPKCFTFWCTLAYGCSVGCYTIAAIPQMLAVSFLASYSALWLELLEGFIDTLYLKLYGKICNTSDNTAATGANGGDYAGTVPELRQNKTVNN